MSTSTSTSTSTSSSVTLRDSALFIFNTLIEADSLLNAIAGPFDEKEEVHPPVPDNSMAELEDTLLKDCAMATRVVARLTILRSKI